MSKFLNLISFLIFILFFFYIFNHYISDKNILKKNTKRSNIENLINNNISNLPVLKNDTNDVIEFNSSFSDELKDNKSRKFWDLLKIK